PLPMLAVLAILVGALARRISGAWWSAPVAVAITFVGLAPNPFGWPLNWYALTYGFGAVEDGSLLRPTLWNSPTHTLGSVLSLGPVGAAGRLAGRLGGRGAARAVGGGVRRAAGGCDGGQAHVPAAAARRSRPGRRRAPGQATPGASPRGRRRGSGAGGAGLRA